MAALGGGLFLMSEVPLFSQDDVLGVRYKPVDFEAEKRFRGGLVFKAPRL